MLTKCLLFLLTAGLIYHSKDPKPPLTALGQLINKYYTFCKRYPQQKIYVHIDKPNYVSGDDLYGKIYLVNESKADYDSIRSKTIFVELINEENTVVKKIIVNGLDRSPGFSFHLNDTMGEGNYVLRAYTSWMAGFNNNQNIFNGYLHIFNKGNQIQAILFYEDSTFSSLRLQLKDNGKSFDAGATVHYVLTCKNKIVEQADVTTNSHGELSVNVKKIALEDRDEATIKIKTGSAEKLLHFPSITNNIDIQFLPEGGNLVNNIENNVAFKAIDKYGQGTEVHGYIKDQKGAIISSFKSSHLGMGKFAFTPESGSSYTAYLESTNNRKINHPFSPADNYAYQVSIIKKSKDNVRIRVALGDSLYQKNIVTYLVATSHGRVCFTSRGTDLYEEDIPLDSFPEGIAQLTLFDSSMQPVSERLLYVHPPGTLVTITANKDNYRQREKVIISLKTTDKTGRQLNGRYSISVTDDNTVKHEEESANIKSHLLLSPYLKGYIEHPGYYFKHTDSITKEDLDLVMLTHGWSRFSWSNVESNKNINTSKRDSSLYITGRLTNVRNIPVSRYHVSLFSRLNNSYVGTAITNEKGEFRFTGIDLTDSTSFIVQTTNEKGVNEDVNISNDDPTFPATNFDRAVVPGKINPGLPDGLKSYASLRDDSSKYDMEKLRVLKNIALYSTKKKVNYIESMRVSPASYIITPDFIERYGNLNLKDVLYSVPGVTIFDGHISFFGRNSMKSYSDPLLVLDGVENSGALEINPQDVDFIEVLRGGEAAAYGMRGGNGVVLVYTKKGKDVKNNFKQKGIRAMYFPGYHIQKEFYSPKYETIESLRAKTKDERSTIYWNGNVTMDSNNPSIVTFYTADMPATYTFTIEGIAENGAVIHETFPVNRTKQ